MTVRIPKALLDQAFAQARATPDVEICGLLWGSRDAVTRIEPAANVACDPRRWFEIDPQTLITALRASRVNHEKVVGYYHSHPTGSAEPSVRDLAAAEPGKLWLILAGGSARLWFAEPGRFRETKLFVT